MENMIKLNEKNNHNTIHMKERVEAEKNLLTLIKSDLKLISMNHN